jgi:hypothetical protein
MCWIFGLGWFLSPSAPRCLKESGHGGRHRTKVAIKGEPQPGLDGVFDITWG